MSRQPDRRPFRAVTPATVTDRREGYGGPALLLGWYLDPQGRDAEAVIITMTHLRQPYEIGTPATPVPQPQETEDVG